MMRAVIALAVCAAASAAPTNMNGLYEVASGEHQDVGFNTDYASKGHEYFDVYSPEIATHYGEVFWTMMAPVAIPEQIRKRFAGKVMAITGYEQDQVMKTASGDVSVPINWAYNHHYMSWMTGSHSTMKEVEADPNDVSSHGAPTKWIAVDLPSAALRTTNADIPTSQLFSEGNGGESRKSFHGYPDGYAQLIDSPTSWKITPMQIDTRNRDCGVGPESITNCTKKNPVPYPGFTPGPEPRQARYGRGIPKGTKYSGLLECPCNSRYGADYGNQTKVIQHSYSTFVSGQCKRQELIGTPAECFEVAQSFGIPPGAVNTTVSDASQPAGCSVRTAGGGVSVVFNSVGNGTCGGASKVARGSATSPLQVRLGLELDAAADKVTITLSGPANVWFGVGFNATLMRDQPWTVIVNSSMVMERKIGTCGEEGDHCPGDVLKSSVTVVSNTVSGSVRTVVLTRPLAGASPDHFTFDMKRSTTLPFITAFGSSQEFAFHRAHAPAVVTLFAEEAGTCLCDVGQMGKLCGPGGVGCQQFVKDCVPAPAGDLLAQANPTCNSRSYIGGLQCCGHKRIMLDADQEVRPELLRYHMKFRFWFQELTVDNATGKASHENLPRIYYQTEAHAGEYDIPPAFAPALGYPNWPPNVPTPGTSCTGACPDGDDCECIHTITFRWTVSNMRLIYAGGHCHAPSCVSMELYRADTGKLLCRQIPVYGKGNEDDKFDEEGYIALPPCLWGNDKGLQPSEFMGPNTPLLAVKRNRNTEVGHFGDMASWQMRGIDH
eukprot:TRINITY_DN67_c0_g2_i2.p1 TRINITY_DN67_c0_g2~~TRINITY_DN67_c0_g2_i2.p1  ORF type:complete len:775 (+),score=214.49 TRINITY_DN67_c0_g2_i2:95-2419(+)